MKSEGRHEQEIEVGPTTAVGNALFNDTPYLEGTMEEQLKMLQQPDTTCRYASA